MGITFDSEQAKDPQESSRTRQQLSYDPPLVNIITLTSICIILCMSFLNICHEQQPCYFMHMLTVMYEYCLSSAYIQSSCKKGESMHTVFSISWH